MICLAFTRNRLLAGVKLNRVELLPIKGNTFIEYKGQTMSQVLKSNLSDLQFAYANHVRKQGVQPEPPIPVALAFPEEYSLDGNKAHKYVKEVLRLLDKETFKKFAVVHIDHIGHSYAHHLIKDSSLRNKPTMLIDSTSDVLGITYLNTKGKVNGNQYQTIEEIGYKTGKVHLLNNLLSEFESSGLDLNATDKEALSTQIISTKNDHKDPVQFKLNKSSGNVKIQAEISLPSRTYYELLSKNLDKLNVEISESQLRNLKIEKVLLMGDLVRNEVFQEYLSRQTQLNGKVVKVHNNEREFEVMISGLAERTLQALEEEQRRREEEARKLREQEERRRREEEERKRKARLEAERKAREEAERKRKEEEARKARLEAEKKEKQKRDELIGKIQLRCVDPDQKGEYESFFIAEGAKLNIPAEVIKWTIEDALKSRKLQTSITQTIMPVQTMLPVQNQVQQLNPSPQEDLSRHPKLYDLYEIESVMIDHEFSTKKAIKRDNSARKIIRILDRAQMNDPKLVSNFRKLYKKELKYFKQLSEITTVQEGMYYSRDFVECLTIKEYIRKLGIDKKTNLDALKSNDLKLILQVFKEIRNLEVAHAALDEDNIQVIYNRRWNLQREVELRFSGFTSVDCSVKEMEAQLHILFSKIIDPNVYAEFRQRFNV